MNDWPIARVGVRLLWSSGSVWVDLTVVAIFSVLTEVSLDNFREMVVFPFLLVLTSALKFFWHDLHKKVLSSSSWGVSCVLASKFGGVSGGGIHLMLKSLSLYCRALDLALRGTLGLVWIAVIDSAGIGLGLDLEWLENMYISFMCVYVICLSVGVGSNCLVLKLGYIYFAWDRTG